VAGAAGPDGAAEATALAAAGADPGSEPAAEAGVDAGAEPAAEAGADAGTDAGAVPAAEAGAGSSAAAPTPVVRSRETAASDSSAARMRFIEGGHSRKSGALYEKRSAGTICAGLAKPCEV
jgi:hypothetical protein